MSTTPYMNLLLPDPTITPGPLYATENNSAFGVIDAHDHTTGKGVKVPTAGININGDLDFGDFNATGFRSLRLTANISPLGTVSDLGCVYRSGIDLWYNDGNGVQIQLTAGGGLNAASIGAIGGDYTTSTASVFYTSASKTFSFTQDTNKAAAMDFGPFTFRRESLSAPGITFQPDITLASDYTMTWPGALPGATYLMQVSTSGAVSFVNPNTIGYFAASTGLVFFQASAPTGWTKQTAQNSKFLRVVSGTGGGAGGSFGLGSESSHTHTGPSHTHTVAAHNHQWLKDESFPTASHSYQSDGVTSRFFDTVNNVQTGGSTVIAQLNDNSQDAYTTNASLTTDAAGTGSTGSGSSHTHTHTVSEHAYIDVIVCTKD